MTSSGKKNVNVAVRCRPFNESEKAKASTRIIKINGEKVVIHNPGNTAGTKEHIFTFDNNYFWDTKNEQIFKDIGIPAVTNIVNGINSTLVIYGQKYSGKEFTFAGGHDDVGIVPMICKELFRLIDESASNIQFFTTVSYAEVYQDILHDLLNPSGQDLKVSKNAQLGVFVDGLSELVCVNGEDMQELFEQGNRVNKILSNQEQNNDFRRGSLVFSIDIQKKDLSKPDHQGLKAKLTIVNLADSDHFPESLEKHQDSSSIEKSINSLTNVISTISESNRANQVVYDQSKLTSLLQESFGGNCQTFFIAAVSPADADFHETLSTLQIASKVRNIQNSITKNKIDNIEVIEELRAEISRLRDKLIDKKFTKSPERDDVLQMEEKVRELQVAKRQTWEEKERLSHRYEEERRINLANKGILGWVFDSIKKENKEIQEKLALLRKEKDQLMIEYKERRRIVDEMKDELQIKITEYSKLVESGKNKEEESKNKISEIQEMKERLKQENDNLKRIKHQLKENQEKQKIEKEEAKSQTSFLKGNTELRQRLQSEQRDRYEKDNAATLVEEADRIKMESEQEKADLQLKGAEGTVYSTENGVKLEMEIVELKAERAVMSLKIQALENEKKRLQSDLELAYKQHKEETEIQQLQNFQTFRNYRDVFEEQKLAIEQRYRSLLEEAIQDAVFLSATNQDLMFENQQLKLDMAEIKDKLTVSGLRIDSPDVLAT
ncbi:kinesin-II 85 kDa subunit-like [Dendronephthya gigantea]|uniref:kinesin-II 85 kDa subunit-like n=1 Tax=Dendronephthya gigantea TaxID=151771 RepID=UPI001069C010|nr:kinesin-II 85 kDa subunit-like [Dendronephthya gigantea]